jgi:flagellin-like hook-associated protein FlgL
LKGQDLCHKDDVLSIRIGSNIAALQAQRSLGKADESLQSIYTRLSSGMRINRASDDAAGLSIASSLNTDSRIFTQAIRNVNDGISLLNIAEGALSSVTGITERLRELTFQSANGTYSNKQRAVLGIESDRLVEEFNRIIASTSFNGVSFFNGTSRDLSLQVGRGTGAVLNAGVGNSLGRTTGNGQGSSESNISSSFHTLNVFAVDVNNDGKLDLIRGAGSQANGIVVQIGNGDGTFGVEVSYYSQFSARLQVADLNNDGHIDIVGAGDGSGRMNIVYGRGDGTFGSAASYSSGYSSSRSDFRLADVNGDGLEDIVNFGSSGGGYSVMLGNSNGSFQTGVTYALSSIDGSSSFELGDLNNDGRMDLVYATTDNSLGTPGTVVILYGNGNGSFGGASTQVISGLNGGRATNIALGDLDRDGNLDIITTNNSASSTRVLKGNGNGTFESFKSYNTTASYNSITLADLNNDGILDFVSAVFSGQIQTMIGNGDGTFGAMKSFTASVGSVYGGAFVADLDNDGSMELLFGRNATSTLIVNQVESYSANLEYLNLSTQASSLASLSYLDSATTRIQRELGSIGALMSRLGVAGSHLSSIREQYKAAESRIMDVDVAEESSALISKRIVQQAAAAILAQASQQPALALRLLQ